MNEFEFIEWIRNTRTEDVHTAVGPGDDCAVIRMGGRDMVISTDTIAEHIHFSEGADPYRIGWKAAASSLSDIAACGCEPLGIVAACLVPEGRGKAYLEKIYRGLEDVCGLFGIGLAGGDMSASARDTSVTVTSFGRVHEQGITARSGAVQDDCVYVTGSLGESQHLECVPRIREALRLREICTINSMIDISDGLLSELNHISRESGVGIQIDTSAVPLSPLVMKKYPDSLKDQVSHALSDGEDFELLFTLSPESTEKLEHSWDMDVPVTRIGLCAGPPGAVELNPDPVGIDISSLTPYTHEF